MLKGYGLSYFFPTSSSDFTPGLQPGQRYRHPFGDLRLAKRHADLLKRLCEKQTAIIHQLSDVRKDIKGAYRFVDKVDLAELIHQTSRIEEASIRGKDLQVNLDSSSFNLKLGNSEFRKRWASELGVVGDNRTPGFYVMCALILERATQHCVGLGDVLFHRRPLNKRSQAQKLKARAERRKLPFEQRESAAWGMVACQTAHQLKAARRITFVMDQGGDSYEVFHRILCELKRDFIVRAKYDRQARLRGEDKTGSFSELLESQPWMDVRTVPIRALDHYSKTSGQRVVRQKRKANLALRFIQIQLLTPPGQQPIRQPLTLIEVLEDEQTVPAGETPIHWRLLSSWPIDTLSQAWAAVDAYQGRWHIEQLFRCTKKQGLDVEHSQLRDPQAIMKLTVMALKASAEALRLTQVRDGEPFVPIQTMFDEEQQELLEKLNARLSGHTEKVTNPYPGDSLAWAAWIIARLGGWKGYASQRKPGPITMTRGLIRFYDLFFWFNVNFSP